MIESKAQSPVETGYNCREERSADKRDGDEVVSSEVGEDELEAVQVNVVCGDHGEQDEEVVVCAWRDGGDEPEGLGVRLRLAPSERAVRKMPTVPIDSDGGSLALLNFLPLLIAVRADAGLYCLARVLELALSITSTPRRPARPRATLQRRARQRL